MLALEAIDIVPCRIEVITSRIFGAMDADGNNNIKLGTTKRCLFGKPAIEDTKQLLEERCELEKKRFKDRFGIDIENIENVCQNMGNEDTKRDLRKEKRTARRAAGKRLAFRPYNKQLKLTGGCIFFVFLCRFCSWLV